MGEDLTAYLPAELVCKILQYFDLNSLHVVSQLNRFYLRLSLPLIYHQPKFATCAQFKKFISCIKLNLQRLEKTAASQSFFPDNTLLPDTQAFAHLIKEIDLSVVPSRWHDITNEDICNCMLLCPNVTMIDLSLCELKDTALAIITKKYGDKLTHLNLYKCTKVEDFSGITKHCPNLVFLDLSYTNIEDDELQKIIQNTHETLNWLSLEGCDMITDTSVERLVTCPNLDYINIQGCYGILNSYDLED
ncbi:hypothetical protein DSO57_1036406 [Entomophthora muscae]|uniref:Uncharacterized protein n=1 Tax=Entomophthora muscae TaxID=34485 RepID=A0ACC2TLN7_9FUNG|nr:hypothetical protein DSO57_1036406 [Entomophthora muscae]